MITCVIRVNCGNVNSHITIIIGYATLKRYHLVSEDTTWYQTPISVESCLVVAAYLLYIC